MYANITFSADAALLKKAKLKALQENQALNRVFRHWLAEYAAPSPRKTDFKGIMKQLSYGNAGKKFSREELNER